MKIVPNPVSHVPTTQCIPELFIIKNMVERQNMSNVMIIPTWGTGNNMLLLFTIVAFLKPLLHFLNPLYAELIVEKPRPTKTNDDNIVINSDVGACLMGSIFLEFLGGNNSPHHWIREILRNTCIYFTNMIAHIGIRYLTANILKIIQGI